MCEKQILKKTPDIKPKAASRYKSGCALGFVGKEGQRTGGAGVHHSGLWELVLQVEHRLAHLCRRSILGFVAFVKNNLREGGVKGQTLRRQRRPEGQNAPGCLRAKRVFRSFAAFKSDQGYDSVKVRLAPVEDLFDSGPVLPSSLALPDQRRVGSKQDSF